MTDAFGGQKYTLLSKLVKSLLTLLHSSADVESVFTPKNTSYVGLSLHERILNEKLYVIDELETYGGKPKSFPIRKEFFTFAKSVWFKYQDYVESKAKE